MNIITELPTQLHIGYEEPCIDLMMPIQNSEIEMLKPYGGLWTSTYKGDNYYSEWYQFCIEVDMESGDKAWLLKVKPNVRIAVVNSYEDLEALHDKYSRYKNGMFSLTKSSLDYEMMANAVFDDLDGIHLTDKGQRETRLSFPFNLYGYDCESTLFFKWVFEDIQPIHDFTWGEYE